MPVTCLTLWEMNSSSQLTSRTKWNRDCILLFNLNNLHMTRKVVLLVYRRILSLTWCLTLLKLEDIWLKPMQLSWWLSARWKPKSSKKTKWLRIWMRQSETNYTLRISFMIFRQACKRQLELHSTDLFRWVSYSRHSTPRLTGNKLATSRSTTKTKNMLERLPNRCSST